MNILLFGAPGAGKGTQAALLTKQAGYVHISTGDLFRNAIKNNTVLGKRAKEFLDSGSLVPDSLTIDLVDEQMAILGKKSFLLDGFPRNVVQAEALAKLLSKRNLELACAIFIEVPKGILVARLSGRRVCKVCGATFHVDSKPVKSAGRCDSCGGEVIQRSDDREEVIKNRLQTYEENTLPLKSYYADRKKLKEVDGNRKEEIVYKEILSILQN